MVIWYRFASGIPAVLSSEARGSRFAFRPSVYPGSLCVWLAGCSRWLGYVWRLVSSVWCLDPPTPPRFCLFPLESQGLSAILCLSRWHRPSGARDRRRRQALSSSLALRRPPSGTSAVGSCAVSESPCPPPPPPLLLLLALHLHPLRTLDARAIYCIAQDRAPCRRSRPSDIVHLSSPSPIAIARDLKGRARTPRIPAIH